MQLDFYVIGQADVEARDVHHRDLLLADGLDSHFNCAIFQADTLTSQRNYTGFGAFTCRQDLQAHLAALRPFDQRDNIVKTPTDHVHHRFACLANADNTVTDGDRLALGCRAACHHGVDHGVIIIHLQHGTNPFQRETHLGIELFGIAWRQVVGVRIDFVGKRGHDQREHVFAVALRQAFDRKLITLGQCVTDLFIRFAGQLQVQLIVFDLGIPQAVQFSLVFRPRRFAAVYVNGVVAGEVHRLVEQR
ncbi:hypothetical protein D3C79_773520 [compost metagenome]